MAETMTQDQTSGQATPLGTSASPAWPAWPPRSQAPAQATSAAPASPAPDQDYSHLAQAWQGFSEGRRKSLLGKMSPEQKKGLRMVLEKATSAGGATATASSSPTDLTAQPTGKPAEGLYKMRNAAGDALKVPYSNVLPASKQGYQMTPAVRGKFLKDLTYAQEKKLGRKLSEKEYTSQPRPDLTDASQQPGWWDRLRATITQATEPTTIFKGSIPNPSNITLDPAAGEAMANVAKRVGRVLFDIPDFGVQAYRSTIDALSSDPETSAKGEEALLSLHPGTQIHDRLKEVKTDFKRDPKLAGENIAGDVIGIWLSDKAGRVGGKVREVIAKAPEAGHGLLREAAGIRTKTATDLVESTMAENAEKATKAEQQNVEATQQHQEKTQEALHEQTGRETEHQQAVNTEAEKIRTAEAGEAAKRQAQHAEAARKAEAAQAAAAQQAEAATTDAQKDFFRKHAEHQQHAQQVETENARLQGEHATALAAHEELQTRLNQTDRAAKPSLRLIEKNVHDAASQEYADLAPKLASFEADPENVSGMVDDAAESVDPAVGEPPLLTKFEKLLKNKQVITYADLDSFRSAINATLRKQQVPGSTYHIYRNIMEPVIIDEMERIASDHGLSAEAAHARASWRTWAESFRDKASPLRKVLKDPEQHGALKTLRGKQSYLDRLRKFGPEGEALAKQVEQHLAEAQQAKALYSTYGDIKVPVPKPPKMEKVPEFTEKAPEPVTARTVSAPAKPTLELTAGSPEERAAQAVKQPDRPPFPDRPTEVRPEFRKLGPEDILDTNRNQYMNTVKKLRDRGVFYGAVLPWLWVARDLLTLNLGKAALNAIGAGVSSVVTAAGVLKLTDLLEKPEIRDWVAKPSAREIAELNKLPPEQRKEVADGFRKITAAAAKRGLKVSPLIGAFIAASAATGTKNRNVEDFMAVPNPKGMIKLGNLPIWDRPTVQNDDGTHSSEYSTSFEDDNGHEVLVPTIVDGKFLTPDGKKPLEGSKEEKAMFRKAWQHYLKTGEHLGVFDNADDADAYSQQLHNRGTKNQKPQDGEED